MPGITNLMLVGGHRRDGGTADVIPDSITDPVITTDGTPAVGETITVSNGSWTGAPTSFTYSWRRGATTVGGNSPSYTLQAADAGQSILCVVTASNEFGSGSAQSNAISVVAGSGTLLFSDGFEHAADSLRSNFVPPWAGLVRSFADRIQTQTSSEAGFSPRVGTYSVKVTANNSDTNSGAWTGDTSIGQRPPTNNPRAQFEGPLNLFFTGDEIYLGFSFRYPSSTPTVNTWGLCWQVHGPDSNGTYQGSPNYELTTTAGTLKLVSNATSTGQPIWNGPAIPKDQWLDFTLRIFWSKSTSGYVEVWYGGVKQTLVNGTQRVTHQNVKSSQVSIKPYITNYRAVNATPGDVTYYFDSYKIGSSFAIVQP